MEIKSGRMLMEVITKGQTLGCLKLGRLEFVEVSAERLWEAISEPGNLNDSHPFCDSNEVISWEDGDRSDRLVYLSGLNYVRRFKTWKHHWMLASNGC